MVPVYIRKNNKRPIFKSKKRVSGNEEINFYYGQFDLTEFLEHDKEQEEAKESKKTLLCFCYYRKPMEPPLTKIEFIDLKINPETGNALKVNTKMKVLPYTFNLPQKR